MEIDKIDFTKIDKIKPRISKDESQITIFSADRLDGNKFQDFVAKLLESNGFTDVSVTGRTGDQGGDLLAKKDG
ncbi:MAG TPA: restriction endonuclease, partial [Nitrosopumilaceae archaeon]|nr:restriction endonuclease [Nitrosopumilaceae archaeon]